jgi:16S rRNA (guanine527-N7)-methyltransferase
MDMKQFQDTAFALFGVHLSDKQLGQFGLYERHLQTWNQDINLTAISDTDGIRQKHFLDSISVMMVLRKLAVHSVVDIGTGAGFPGMVLKILLPDIRLTLVESIGKKVQFCEFVAKELGFSQVTVTKARAEELGQTLEHREKYDVAIARAVAELSILSEYLLPFVRRGGRMVAQKGEKGPAETHTAQNAIQLLGGKVRFVHQITLPGVVEDRYLIEIEKVSSTPEQYPRRVGIPSKRPLQ